MLLNILYSGKNFVKILHLVRTSWSDFNYVGLDPWRVFHYIYIDCHIIQLSLFLFSYHSSDDMASTVNTCLPHRLPTTRKCKSCHKTFKDCGTSHQHCRWHADCFSLGRYHIAACTVCTDLLALAENGSLQESLWAIKTLKEWCHSFSWSSKDREISPFFVSMKEKTKLLTLCKQLSERTDIEPSSGAVSILSFSLKLKPYI